MKITAGKLYTILERHRQLLDRATDFVRQTNKASRWCDIRFSDSNDIEAYENTACHCHPEYEWRMVATQSEFLEWLDKQ